MSAQDDLRMAWVAERAGRFGTRDVLLTLAIASSTCEDDWAPTAWSHLLASRPNHFFAIFPSLSVALDNASVVKSLNQLRQSFPPSRVEHLLARAAVSSGPYYRRGIPLGLVIEDLVGSRSMLGATPTVLRRASSRGKGKDAFKKTGVDSQEGLTAGRDSASKTNQFKRIQSHREELFPTMYVSVLLGLAIIFVSLLAENESKESRAA